MTYSVDLIIEALKRRGIELDVLYDYANEFDGMFQFMIVKRWKELEVITSADKSINSKDFIYRLAFEESIKKEDCAMWQLYGSCNAFIIVS